MEELYERRRNLQERIDNFFGGDEVHYGDQGYQDLLERMVELEMEITEEELDDVSEII